MMKRPSVISRTAWAKVCAPDQMVSRVVGKLEVSFHVTLGALWATAGAAKAAPKPATLEPVRKSRRFMADPQEHQLTLSHNPDKNMTAKDSSLKVHSITILGNARAPPPPSRLCITPRAMDL